jgi:DNA-binding response OmpR family regulator
MKVLILDELLDWPSFGAARVFGIDTSLKQKVLRFLGERQTEMFEVSNGKQAIEIAGKEKPDLILANLVLMDSENEAVVRELRRASVESKVIVITSDEEKSVRERFEKLGISGYIIKPFDDTELIELMGKKTAPQKQTV